MNKIYKFISFILFSFLIINTLFAQSPERNDVPDKHKWNLSEIYPTTADWQADVDMMKIRSREARSIQRNTWAKCC